MKIEYVWATGSITLAEDNAERLGPRDLGKSATRRVQMSEPIGSPGIKQFGRGNRQTRLTFRVRKQYATVAASALGWLTSGDDVLADRQAYIRITQGATIRYIPDAQVHAIEDAPIGISVMLTYTIIGGPIQTGEPSL